MLLSWHRVGLVGQHPQRANYSRPRLVGLDHVVDITPLGRHKRIRKTLAILFYFGPPALIRICRFLQFTPVQDAHCALRSHHRNLCRGIREIDICPQMFRAHHAVRAAVCLASYYRYLWYGRLGVGVKQLRSMADNAAEFLRRAREKTGYVFKRQNRNLECVAEPYKTRALGG